MELASRQSSQGGGVDLLVDPCLGCRKPWVLSTVGTPLVGQGWSSVLVLVEEGHIATAQNHMHRTTNWVLGPSWAGMIWKDCFCLCAVLALKAPSDRSCSSGRVPGHPNLSLSYPALFLSHLWGNCCSSVSSSLPIRNGALV